jgi:hypothetical protein
MLRLGSDDDENIQDSGNREQVANVSSEEFFIGDRKRKSDGSGDDAVEAAHSLD